MRRMLTKILASILVVAMLTGICWAVFRVLEQNYVYWNGSLIPKEEQSLSISGRRVKNMEAFLHFTDLRQLDARDTDMTVEQYEWFCQNLPDCRVIWEIPVQGKR